MLKCLFLFCLCRIPAVEMDQCSTGEQAGTNAKVLVSLAANVDSLSNIYFEFILMFFAENCKFLVLVKLKLYFKQKMGGCDAAPSLGVNTACSRKNMAKYNTSSR